MANRGRGRPQVAGAVARGVMRRVSRVAQPGQQLRPIRFRAGSRGNWRGAGNRRNLQPNATYVEARTGYTYRTDANGRVSSFSGQLQRGAGDRNAYQQAVSGRGDRLPTDQGGHLFAHIFRGPGDRINLVPMDSTLNLSAWKRMENRWADALDAGTPVRVEGRVLYDPTSSSQRPTAFEVVENIGGRRRTYHFVNQ